MASALLAAKADLAAEDLAGSTALTYAASSGHAPIVDLLMTAGLTTGRDLAVSFAVRGCHTDIVRTLRTPRRRPRPQGQRHAAAGAGGGLQL